jgi:DNA-binding transcriptional ArsR family regulator
MVRTTADNDVFRAIADGSRRRLLDALTTGPKSFTELHALLPITKGAVSQHLSILVAVGLVTVNEADRTQRYSLAPAPLEEVDQWLSEYREFWNHRLDRLEQELVRRRRAAP